MCLEWECAGFNVDLHLQTRIIFDLNGWKKSSKIFPTARFATFFSHQNHQANTSDFLGKRAIGWWSLLQLSWNLSSGEKVLHNSSSILCLTLDRPGSPSCLCLHFVLCSCACWCACLAVCVCSCLWVYQGYMRLPKMVPGTHTERGDVRDFIT